MFASKRRPASTQAVSRKVEGIEPRNQYNRKDDAFNIAEVNTGRLEKFKLEVEPTKTKVLEFGAQAAANARSRGERPGTFDFLGFTHYLSKARDGKRFRMNRVTSRKRFRAKLVAFKEWLKEDRVLPLRLILQKASQKLRSHYGYYGVTDNYRGISRFYRQVSKLLYKWLNRRSQRRSYKWAELFELLKRFEVPKPRVGVNLYYRARRTI